MLMVLKSIWCVLTGGHNWVKLVIPTNNFGDSRYEGEICKICWLIRKLRERSV